MLEELVGGRDIKSGYSKIRTHTTYMRWRYISKLIRKSLLQNVIFSSFIKLKKKYPLSEKKNLSLIVASTTCDIT